MKKIVLMIAGLVVLAAGCTKTKPVASPGWTVPIGDPAPTQTEAGTYTDPTYNFQITLPKGFYENTGGYDGYYAYFKYFSTQPGAGASISDMESGKDNTDALFDVSIDHSQGQIYASFAAVKKDEAASSPNIQYSGEKNLTVNGLSAYEVTIDTTQSKGDVDNDCEINTYIQQGSDIDQISLIAANCTVAAKYKSAYESSVATFRFLK